MFLHRQRIGDRSGVEIVAGFQGQRTYSTRLTRRQLHEAAERHGRDIVADAHVEADIWSLVLRRG